ncbi:MAG: type II toxin-antitoxin system VapC family toxin [Bryobacteraceae bacterium]|nr:type II toxin-antitoxin system VapC family toxin [Bryobacteraceae bacterium]
MNSPFLLDTSAESWLTREGFDERQEWLRRQIALQRVRVSAVTVVERVKGYVALWRKAEPADQPAIEKARVAYLSAATQIVPLSVEAGVAAGEIMALLPDPPTPPRRSYRAAESRQERLSRWRFDILIAATALVSRMPLVHNNAADFEPIRGIVERIPSRFPTLGPLDLIRCSTLII